MKIIAQITILIAVLVCNGFSVQDKHIGRSHLTPNEIAVKKSYRNFFLLDKPKPMDKLLRLKWKQTIDVYDKGDIGQYTKPIARNGIVFPGSIATHALSTNLGEKLYYDDPSSQEFIRNQLEDSLLFYSSDEEAVIFNIYSGTILKKNRQKIYPRYPVDIQLSNREVFPIVIENQVDLISSQNNNVIASYNSHSEINGNLLITKDYVFFGNEEGVYFMDYFGNLVDSVMVGKMKSKPFIYDEVIYFFVENYGLTAVDYNTKDILWNQKFNWFDAVFTAHSDTLFTNHGCLTALDINSGNVLWEMDQKEEACSYKYDQLLYCDGNLLGQIGGFSSTNVVGAVDAKNGRLTYLHWKDGGIFGVDKLNKSTPSHPEDEATTYLGPEFIFSEVYGDMVFAQYENTIVAFEIFKNR